MKSSIYRTLATVLVLMAGMSGLFAARPAMQAAALSRVDVDLGSSSALVWQSSPATTDFDGDGDKEIVVGDQDGKLFVVSYHGSWDVGWSRDTVLDLNAGGAPSSCATTTATAIRSSPAIGDLDGDGKLEIVVATGGDPAFHRNGGVLVYEYSSGSNHSLSFIPVTGWPRPADDKADLNNSDGCWDGFLSSPALGDLDGDGDLEVVIEGLDRRIHAWHHDGTPVSGWPIYRYDELGQENNDCLLRGGFSSPALGDIDGDELPEVVVGTNSPPWNCPGNWDQIDYQYATVWAINGDGTNVPGWPVTTENNIQSSPALGDIDGDGELEVVVGSGDSIEGGDGSRVYAWNGNGSPVTGWPKATDGDVLAPPALGDLDADGDLEVVIGCGTESGIDPLRECNQLYAWNGDGNPFPGFPLTSPPLSSNRKAYSPVLADYDGDAKIDILLSAYGASNILVINSDGGSWGVDGSDSLTTNFYLHSSPLVDDLDGDGYTEIAIGGGKTFNWTTDGMVYIWEDDSPTTGWAWGGEMPWPMFHRDAQRTGRYPTPPRLGFTDEIRVYHQEGSSSTATELVRIRNTGDGQFDYAVSESISALTVTPATGTVTDTVDVLFEINVTGIPTGTWQNLGTVTVSGQYGGEAVFESPSSATLYLFVGDIGRAYLPVVLRNAGN